MIFEDALQLLTVMPIERQRSVLNHFNKIAAEFADIRVALTAAIQDAQFQVLERSDD